MSITSLATLRAKSWEDQREALAKLLADVKSTSDLTANQYVTGTGEVVELIEGYIETIERLREADRQNVLLERRLVVEQVVAAKRGEKLREIRSIVDGWD